jgi:hypothetical protein
MSETQLQEQLDAVRSTLNELIDYLDENRMMETIPDYLWAYILKTEKILKK